MTFEQFWNSHGHGYEHGGDMYRALKVCWDVSALESRNAALEEAAREIESVRPLFCEGCKRKKPIMRPSHPSSIVGGAGIHTPEGWVCVTDLILERLQSLARPVPRQEEK